jgi:biopolymer transport protein ExbB
MRKLIASCLMSLLMLAAPLATLVAQDNVDSSANVTQNTAVDSAQADTLAVAATDAPPAVEVSFREMLKEKFIEGGYEWMTPILICLILGLAVSIERIIYLNMATINSKKFIKTIESTLKSGGIEAAKEICRKTPGPIASIVYEGLNRTDEGIDTVEKAVVSYGGVEMGKMERALPWLGLFISLGPMLGFLGTVVGMIFAFDQIEAAGDISPTVVASGIKVALLTTVGGLIVAIILQIFYNYIMSKIDGLVNEMEEASVEFIDILVKGGYTKK